MHIGEGNGTPLQYSCLDNPVDGGAWKAAVMGSLRVGHDWVTSLSLFTFRHWRRKWQPTPVLLPENPRNGGAWWAAVYGGAWWAAVYGVTQSQTWLKRLSSSRKKLPNILKTGWVLKTKQKIVSIFILKIQKNTKKTTNHSYSHNLELIKHLLVVFF